MRDYRHWHEGYRDPGSSQARRLHVVQQRLGELLDRRPPPQRVLSLCAGDGRDVVGVLADRPAGQRPAATLVELDPVLAAAARERARDAGVELGVVVGDAGCPATWRSALPVDVLMLCGIFGNIADRDIRATIVASAVMLRPGGVVVWTRGFLGGPDLRPAIRRWFAGAGFAELSFDSEPRGYGVGVHQLAVPPPAAELPARLFRFVR